MSRTTTHHHKLSPDPRNSGTHQPNALLPITSVPTFPQRSSIIILTLTTKLPTSSSIFSSLPPHSSHQGILTVLYSRAFRDPLSVILLNFPKLLATATLILLPPTRTSHHSLGAAGVVERNQLFPSAGSPFRLFGCHALNTHGLPATCGSPTIPQLSLSLHTAPLRITLRFHA